MSAVDRYRHIADGFTARVEGVPDAAWENPSPCAEWTARGVAAHVIGGTRAALDRLDGVEHVEVPAAEVDPVKDWAAAREAVEAALADPTRAGTEVESPFGPLSFEVLADRILVTDTLIHTWDLARATGGDEHIDPAAAAAALAMLSSLDDDFLRGTGAFAPAVPAPAGAGAVTALICFCGRAF